MDKTEMDPHRKTLIFVNIIIACFATTMMSTALSTALPGIISDFNISASTGQWLTSAYSLAMAVMVPVTSFMVKRVPTRKLFILVIGVFTLGLVIDAFATNFAMLLFGRLLQAGSNGILIAAAQIILLTIYPREVHGRVMGWYGITLTAAPIISPTLAGVLIDTFDWRMVFILPLVIMLVSLVTTFFTFEDVLDTQDLKFDSVSFILCAFAFGGLTFGIGNVMTVGVTGVLFIVPVIVGAVAFFLFTRRQLSLEKPFLQMRLFKSRQFSISMVCCMLLYIIVMSTSLIGPMCFQMGLGYSATESGLIMVPGTILVAVLSPVCGGLYDKYPMKWMVVILSIVMFLSNFLMFFIDHDTPYLWLVFLGILRGIGGAIMMPFTAWAMNSVEPHYKADATSLNNALRTLASAAGMAMFVGVMDSVASSSTYLNGACYAFLLISFVSIIMLVLGLFSKKNTAEKVD